MEDQPARYTIGWIAPLPLELTAAKAVLDEDHGDIHADGYIYHGGKIGKHNVVMAVQPKMGTDAASDLAARVRATFKNVGYFVVVGIGGGVPNYGPSGARSQIVLGDVVVSYPRGRYGGIVPYDVGAWINEGRLEFRGHADGPPASLLAAVNSLKASHSMTPGTKIPTILQEMRLKIHADERENFEDQGSQQDRLYQDNYSHPVSPSNEACENCCDVNRSHKRDSRGIEAARRIDTPKIHYGNIGSSNQLQISASKRNRLHEECEIICFEMEGAGVIKNHPSLVIRGICDYSDSHKNKKWQPYAAATAAAYTKELLETLPASKHTMKYKELAQEKTKDQKSCLQSLAFKEMNMRGNDISQPTSTTCSWLLEHESYQSWVSQQNGLLWIKGNPGVGKSTLMKYALHECKRQAPVNNELVIASFFFHGRGSPLQKSPLGLFRSLLYQILNQVPKLLHEFTSIFKNKCDTEGEPGTNWDWHQTELRDFLQSSIPPVSKVRPIRIYIDALDECGEEVARDLVKVFQCLISELPHTGRATLGICFSCRHYPIIALERGLTMCVEKENYDDIATHVRSELDREDLEQNDAQKLKEEIVKSASGVFQWVVLVVPMVLEFYRNGRSIDEILAKLRDIPKQLDDLYREILGKVKPEYRSETLQLMQWICFARRPLSIPELRSAMAMDADTHYETLNDHQNSPKYVRTDKQMEKRVKSLSGGLIEVVEHAGLHIAQFIHQSVNDHLITGGIRTLENFAEGSVAGLAHFRLSRSCIRYISMKDVSSISPDKILSEITHQLEITHQFPLLNYATKEWVLHAEKVETEGMSQGDLLHLLRWPSNEMMKIWVRLHKALVPYSNETPPEETTLLHVGSRHGFTSMVAMAILRNDTN
ncbi:purine and uridine phosphorylase, partial [Melanomma pulvis-pyrius CBS 109.77]